MYYDTHISGKIKKSPNTFTLKVRIVFTPGTGIGEGTQGVSGTGSVLFLDLHDVSVDFHFIIII